MTTTDYLNAIVAKCKANLALAEKRTQGKWNLWEHGSHNVYVNGHCIHCSNQNDAAFIAACSGAAEAGWKATIAAIEFAQSMPGHFWREALESLIISAWPEELL